MWNFGHRSWLPQRVVFARWDFCCFNWSPSLRGTFVASVGHETFIASVGCLRYVGPLLLQLVASNTWNLWSLQLRETYGRFSYVGPITSVGYLCFVFGRFRNVVSSYPPLWDLCHSSWSPPLWDLCRSSWSPPLWDLCRFELVAAAT